MGVESYEPQVAEQLAHFFHEEASQIIRKSNVVALHRERMSNRDSAGHMRMSTTNVTTDDVRLAIQLESQSAYKTDELKFPLHFASSSTIDDAWLSDTILQKHPSPGDGVGPPGGVVGPPGGTDHLPPIPEPSTTPGIIIPNDCGKLTVSNYQLTSSFDEEEESADEDDLSDDDEKN
eukprot:GHVL01035487.1.p1 GENE.GHVL01035487.1~~GHVL01035487.1.p1  ORF type:complete len:203 (-),score=53.01 GHVL01035487.1:296-826(-)